MPISLTDLAAFSEQDVAAVLADELADSAERYKPVSSPTAGMPSRTSCPRNQRKNWIELKANLI